LSERSDPAVDLGCAVGNEVCARGKREAKLAAKYPVGDIDLEVGKRAGQAPLTPADVRSPKDRDRGTRKRNRVHQP
jgi:hypothetical protein